MLHSAHTANASSAASPWQDDEHLPFPPHTTLQRLHGYKKKKKRTQTFTDKTTTKNAIRKKKKNTKKYSANVMLHHKR